MLSDRHDYVITDNNGYVLSRAHRLDGAGTAWEAILEALIDKGLSEHDTGFIKGLAKAEYEGDIWVWLDDGQVVNLWVKKSRLT